MLLVDEFDGIYSGFNCAIVFINLAYQTGLTELDPEDRFQKLYESIYLFNAIWQHYIHNMVHKLLISLNASHNSSFNR